MTPRRQSILIGAIAMVVAGVPAMSYFDLIPDHLFLLDIALGLVISPVLGGIVAARSYASRAGLSVESELEVGRSRLRAGPVLGAMATAVGLAASAAVNSTLHMIDLGFQSWISSAPQMQEASLGTIVTATAVLTLAVAVQCLIGAVGGAVGTRIFGSGDQQEEG